MKTKVPKETDENGSSGIKSVLKENVKIASFLYVL